MAKCVWHAGFMLSKTNTIEATVHIQSFLRKFNSSLICVSMKVVENADIVDENLVLTTEISDGKNNIHIKIIQQKSTIASMKKMTI